MNIYIHQVNSIIGNINHNAEIIIRLTNETPPGSISIFPELMLSGYPTLDLAEMDWFLESIERKLEHIQASVEEDRLCIFGTILRSLHSDGKKAQNTCIGLTRKGIIHNQAKFLLPSYDIFHESRNFEPSRSTSVLTWRSLTIATAICEDIWGEVENRYQESPIPSILSSNPHLLIVISASPYTKQKKYERHTILKHIAKQYAVPICYCNLIGATDGIVFDGCSSFVQCDGSIAAEASNRTPDTILASIIPPSDTQTLPEKSLESKNTTEKIDAHPQLLLQENAQPPTPSPAPISLPNNYSFASPKNSQDIVDALSLGIHDFCHKNGFEKVHIGLSGGIDSALVACLASIALGPHQVLGIMMPSHISSPASITDSLELASVLGIQTKEIPIEDSVQALSTTLEHSFSNAQSFDLMRENVQARIRGTILMAYANTTRSLLLSTGNKSEMATGYCTLYGDMCGGLAVIADLYKTEVYTLYRHLQKNYALLPENICKKPPSAELRPDQTDQDTLPPYADLDEILRLFIEEHRSTADILALGFQKEMIATVLSLVSQAEFKRHQAPPIIKISPVSFGDGRRISISTQLHFF